MGLDNKSPVTMLGLGPMGQALAGAFLAAGHPTTVWNRTAAKADALVARGAKRAATVAEAVAASELVIVCVIDYAAARAIVEPAAEALRGRTLVNLTADTPERARELAQWAAERGIDYLDGAIMTPTETIGGPSSVLIYSGPEEVYQRHRSTLASLGGTATYLGGDPGRAAAHDVALLDIFWTCVHGVAHGLALAGAEGVSAAELEPFAQGIAELLPSVISQFAASAEGNRHSGDEATLRSALAGMEHIHQAAESRGLDASVIAGALRAARRGVEAGHGEDGVSRLVELLRAPVPAAR